MQVGSVPKAMDVAGAEAAAASVHAVRTHAVKEMIFLHASLRNSSSASGCVCQQQWQLVTIPYSGIVLHTVSTPRRHHFL